MGKGATNAPPPLHHSLHCHKSNGGATTLYSRLRILIVNQFYPPDVAPTGQVAHDVATCLVARGHAVGVVCSRESYSGHRRYASRERLDGVDVTRLSTIAFGGKSHLRKLLSYASFYVLVCIRLLICRPRPDVVISLTTPPYVGLLVRLVGVVRRWRRVHWIMDLYPDVLVAHGLLGYGLPGRLAHRFLAWLTRRELAGALVVLTLGADMAERVKAYVGADGPVDWVPLWSRVTAEPMNAEAIRARRCACGWGEEELVLLYSGNMGLGHRFGEFLQAACGRRGDEFGTDVANGAAVVDAGPRGDGPRRRFVFAGHGKRRIQIETFKEAHPAAPVDLMSYVPMEELGLHLQAADVLLASLGASWSGCMLPSKLQGMFAAGRPVIFVGPRRCSMATWIREAGAGWVVGPGDLSGMLACLEEAGNAALRREKGENARRYARQHFDKTRNCGRIASLIEERMTEAG